MASLNNSVNAVRRAGSGWVVSSVVSIRSALRSVSNLPTARLSRLLSTISNRLSPEPRRSHRPVRNLAVVAQRKMSEPAKTLSFRAKRQRPRSLRHMK